MTTHAAPLSRSAPAPLVVSVVPVAAAGRRSAAGRRARLARARAAGSNGRVAIPAPGTAPRSPTMMTISSWRSTLAVALLAIGACVQPASAQPAEDAARLINQVRQQVAGCGEQAQAADGVQRPALAWNPRLAAAAEEHARAMAEQAFFDHVGRDGRRVGARADSAGYNWRSIGENLAAGQRSLEEAISGWLRSPGHCRTLLDARYTEFGIARAVSTRANDRYRVYWALVVARPAALQTSSAAH